MGKPLKDEKGQALPLALIALVLGALLVGSFLSYVSTNLLASRLVDRLVDDQYAADAGVEDAVWNLVFGDFAESLQEVGDTLTYSPTESVNGLLSSVTVTRVETAIAWDDFETGGWAGGAGWLADWQYDGNAQIVTSHQPHEGSYHLMLRSTAYAKRDVDLLGKADVHLQFWAKADSFETGEQARCLVSSDGSNWSTVKNWEDGDDDNLYRFYDIDLSPYTLSSQFWVAFEADMVEEDDYLFIDDLSVRPVAPGVALLPSDDFESGDFCGGLAWLDCWLPQGTCQVTKKQGPHEGAYHLEISGSNSSVKRDADLSGLSGLRLQFWAKVRSFEAGDEMYCRVSSDGSLWTTVKTWTSADSDNTYYFYDIDLSPYTMSSEFWIQFNSGMNKTNDYFYVDALAVVGAGAGPDALTYRIVSTAASKAVRAILVTEGSELTVLSWVTE